MPVLSETTREHYVRYLSAQDDLTEYQHQDDPHEEFLNTRFGKLGKWRSAKIRASARLNSDRRNTLSGKRIKARLIFVAMASLWTATIVSAIQSTGMGFLTDFPTVAYLLVYLAIICASGVIVVADIAYLKYDKLIRTNTNSREAHVEAVITNQKELANSVSTDLQKAGYQIFDVDRQKFIYTTHRGIITLTTNHNGELMLSRNGQRIHSNYANHLPESALTGETLRTISGDEIAANAPKIWDKNNKFLN